VYRELQIFVGDEFADANVLLSPGKWLLNNGKIGKAIPVTSHGGP
jgi:hypothetical protein